MGYRTADYSDDLLKQTHWDESEIQSIMREHKIWQITISNQEMYNSTAEQCLNLQEKIMKDRNDIISSCWFAVLMDSLTEFEFAHPEIDWETEDDRKEDEGAVYFQGREVTFDYKGQGFKQEETDDGEPTTD